MDKLSSCLPDRTCECLFLRVGQSPLRGQAIRKHIYPVAILSQKLLQFSDVGLGIGCQLGFCSFGRL